MRRFGLLGKSLKHSFSRKYFQDKFSAAQITDCSYENFELASIGLLGQFLEANPTVEGFNVTIPYKEEIVPLLDKKDEVVQKVGACNCVRIENGKLHGFNTDVAGFKNALSGQLQPYHNNALILGSGGASKAVEFVLRELAIHVQIVSRNKKKDHLVYEELDQKILSKYLLIVNTTPAGMFPNIDDMPPIPYQYLTKRHFLFDLIYNPPMTHFLTLGKKAGSQISNGYQMLVLQAEESWRIWNGRES